MAIDRIYKKDIDYYDDRYNNLEHDLEIKRRSKYKITFDFIPEIQNFRNVRSASYYLYGDYLAWSEIRNLIENKNKGVCEVCKKTSFDRQFVDPKKKITSKTEVHEIWSFNEVKKPVWNRVQRLERLSARCFYCHKISHCNMVFDNSLKNKMFDDYCLFNGVTLERAKIDYDWAIEEKKKNDDYQYLLDMTLINGLPVKCRFENDRFDCHSSGFVNFLYNEFIDDE